MRWLVHHAEASALGWRRGFQLRLCRRSPNAALNTLHFYKRVPWNKGEIIEQSRRCDQPCRGRSVGTGHFPCPSGWPFLISRMRQTLEIDQGIQSRENEGRPPRDD
jgi:hypothetical protein